LLLESNNSVVDTGRLYPQKGPRTGTRCLPSDVGGYMRKLLAS